MERVLVAELTTSVDLYPTLAFFSVMTECIVCLYVYWNVLYNVYAEYCYFHSVVPIFPVHLALSERSSSSIGKGKVHSHSMNTSPRFGVKVRLTIKPALH